MRVEGIRTLYDYYYWANARILDRAARVGDAQFGAPPPLGDRGLRALLVHTMSTERGWRSGWQGLGRPAPLRDEDFPTVASVVARWREEEAETRAYLAGLRDEDLEGRFYDFALWHTLVHVVNHGTQHRSEAAVLLTSLGHSPGDLDFSRFARERPGALVATGTVADLRLLYGYTYWATARILERAARVSAEQFIAPAPVPWRSLRGTLVHTLDVEASWRAIWQGRPEVWDAPALPDEDFPTAAALAARWREDEGRMRAYLAGLCDDDLARAVDLPSGPVPLWPLLVHVVNHGMQHRSEAAMLLTEYGHSPGDLDLAFFARGR